MSADRTQWQCSGCGVEVPDFIRRCDCATGVAFRIIDGKIEHEHMKDKMSEIGMAMHDTPKFTLEECPQVGGPCFFWISPYTGQKEKIATLWWPGHPPEMTDIVEHLFENLHLEYRAPEART